MKSCTHRLCATLAAMLTLSLPAMAHAVPSAPARARSATAYAPKAEFLLSTMRSTESYWAVSAIQDGFRIGGATLKVAVGSSKLSIGCSLEL